MHCTRKAAPLLGAALTLAALLNAGAAHASGTVDLTATSPSGAATTFTYHISIGPSDSIASGNFFRIYDFGGYVPGSITAPAGWTATTSLTNPTPPPNVILSYGDAPTIPNLIFTYTGSSPITGPKTIDGFSAQTTTFAGSYVIKDFAARVSTAVGFADSGGATVVAPASAAVPEPSQAAALGLGALGVLGLFVRARRRTTVAA